MSSTWDNYIGGKTVPSSSGAYLETLSPIDASPCAKVARSEESDVAAAVESALGAQAEWAARKPIERGRILMKMAQYLREHLQEFAAVEIRETGKPAWQAPIEINASADYLEMYGGLCNLHQGEKIDTGAGYHCYTVREPFGVVGVITPWNAPLNQMCRGIGPALVVGNTVVGKPSEYTSGTTLMLAQAAVEHCGLPAGVFNVVLGEGPVAGAAVVHHDDVRKVAFTGSVRAGREIGKIAADRIIPLTLELGGKSPNIVFDDADLSAAIPGSLQGFAMNAGQVCSAGTRCLVQKSIYDAFVGGMKQAVDSVKVGPEPDAMIGAIITRDQYERVQKFFAIAEQDGATLITGGADARKDSWGDGWYAPLTIYANVDNSMRIAQEEIFGPILSIIPFEDEKDAIRIANDTDYGLASGIWTTNLSRAHRVAAQLKAGSVHVNEYLSTDVELPFGGYKNSGYGKEKGIEALHHYTQVKMVRIKL